MLSEGDLAAIQFSGGKDSLACVFLAREWWDQTIVVWVNPGAAIQDTLDTIEKVRGLVPNFVEIKTDQPGWIDKYGYPSDVVPVKNTMWGHYLEPHDGIKIQPWTDCCMNNLWRPMDEAIKSLGVNVVIRGQKKADKKHAKFKSGSIVDGIKYVFPLEYWTNEDVFAYLKKEAWIPEHYKQTKMSLDCWSCTAFLDEDSDRVNWLKKYPDKHEEYMRRAKAILSAIDESTIPLRKVNDKFYIAPAARSASD